MMPRTGRPRGTAIYPVIDGKKECSKCHLMLSVERFNKTRSKYGRVYLRGECKGCAALRKAAWQKRSYKGARRRKNRKDCKVYYAANKTEIQTRRRIKKLQRVLRGA